MEAMKTKSVWGMLKQTLTEFSEDKVLRHSAALAYYAVFSIGPLLVLLVGIAGLVLGQENVRAQVNDQLQGAFGQRSAAMVESMMEARQKGGSLLATIMGGIALLFGASGVVGQLQDSLNTIWEVKPKPGRGMMGFVRQRFLSIGMVLGIGFLLLVSMALTIALNALGGYLGQAIGMPEGIAHVLNFIFSLGVVTVLFALIFKVLPDVRMRWSSVWAGALGTALLFTAGKYVLSWYLGRESTTSAFGAASAFVIILMYVYYSSLILFFGAEFTQVYARSRGDALEPTRYAEPVGEQQRAQEGATRDQSHSSGGRRRSPGALSREPVTALRTVGTIPLRREAVGTHVHGVHSPLAELKVQRALVMAVAAAAGLITGAFFTMKRARKAVQMYAFAKRFI